MQNKFILHVVTKNELVGEKTASPNHRSIEYVTHRFSSSAQKQAFLDELERIRKEQIISHGLNPGKKQDPKAKEKFAAVMYNIQRKISPNIESFQPRHTFYLPPGAHPEEFEIGSAMLRIPRDALTHKDVFSKVRKKPKSAKISKPKGRILGMFGSFFSTK